MKKVDWTGLPLLATLLVLMILAKIFIYPHFFPN